MTHKKRSTQEWQQIIETQQASGLSIADFCRQHTLNPSTFYLQRKKVISLNLAPSNNDWLPFSHREDPHKGTLTRQWEIELTLPNGVVLNMSTQG